MVALTTLKPFYQIGYLWKPENQRARELRWVPLDEFSGGSWFAPLFEYAGNTAFFIPFGMLVFSLCRSIKTLSLIHISEPTRLYPKSRMPSSA